MEATKTYFDQLMEDKDFRIKLAEEIFLLEATETIAKAMKKRKMTVAKLAEKMGVSQGYLRNLIAGGRNLTLESLARVLHHLGYEASISIHPTIEVESNE